MNYRLIKHLLFFVLVFAALILPCAAKDRILVEDGDTIAFLGDSITAGGAGHGKYCRLVIHGLKTKGIRAKGIYAGVPGDKSSDMLLRLDGVLDKEPDWLFLSAGVNDIWHGAPDVKIGVFQAKPGMGVDLENYKLYMTQILDRCEKAGTKVVLSTITPITEDPEFKLNKTSEKYNAFLYEQAKKRDLPIAKLNEAMFAKIAEMNAMEENPGRRNMITSDGVHPVTEGDQVMAKGILKAIGFTDKELSAVEKEWESSPKIMIVGDRQVNAGGRTGGWVHMLLDGLNSGREMVTGRLVTKKGAGLAELVRDTEKAIEDGHTKYMLVVPPLGDVKAKTDKGEYEATLNAIADLASDKDLELVLGTIPLRDGGELEKLLLFYNNIVRRVCVARQIPLADIAKIMRSRYRNNSEERLTVGDERVNYEGSALLAETAFAAFGGNAAKSAALREVWDNQGSYTFKYDSSVTFNVPLTAAGEKALEEISDRFHKLDNNKILALGIHELLEPDFVRTDERLLFAEKTWLIPGAEKEGVSLRAIPASANQRKLIAEKTGSHNAARITAFYRRAFLVGMHELRIGDPLGRGKY